MAEIFGSLEGTKGLKITARMEGLNELRLNLQELPKAIQEKLLGNAVAAAAKIVRDKARYLAPILDLAFEASSAKVASILKRRTQGLLMRSIRSTRGVRRNTEASAFVSVRRLSTGAIMKFKQATGKKAAENPNDPFYWSILEFGKSARTAHPFLRPAFNATASEAAEKIRDHLAKGIERIVKQMRKHRAAGSR